LSDYRQHDLTEGEWWHTCCAAQSLWRQFSGRMADASRRPTGHLCKNDK